MLPQKVTSYFFHFLHLFLALIYSNEWGPSPTLSKHGYRYYILFVDDFSRYVWLYPMKEKSESHAMFLQFKIHVEYYFHTRIKIFRSDGGGEFTSQKFQQSLHHFGIIHQTSSPYTSQ